MTRLFLDRNEFISREAVFEKINGFEVAKYLSDTGVQMLRIKNDTIDLVFLPFQGQQVWSAKFNGRDITLKSLVTEPIITRDDYLGNYGGFLVHCGPNVLGGPVEGMKHAIHDELPNASYNRAYLCVGKDSNEDDYIELRGEFLRQIAMTGSYLAQPCVRITMGSPIVTAGMKITNLSNVELPIAYMAHMNFLPISKSKIVSTRDMSPGKFVVRNGFPSHVKPGKEILEYMERVSTDPKVANEVPEAYMCDPELVAYVNDFGDEFGNSHTFALHPNGESDYVTYNVSQAKNSLYVVQRTHLHDSICIAAPSTAGVEGVEVETAKGNMIFLKKDESYSVDFGFSGLTVAQTIEMFKKLNMSVGP